MAQRLGSHDIQKIMRRTTLPAKNATKGAVILNITHSWRHKEQLEPGSACVCSAYSCSLALEHLEQDLLHQLRVHAAL